MTLTNRPRRVVNAFVLAFAAFCLAGCSARARPLTPPTDPIRITLHRNVWLPRELADTDTLCVDLPAGGGRCMKVGEVRRYILDTQEAN